MTTTQISWRELESLCKAEEVDRALQLYACYDSAENAGHVVRAVLDAAAGFRGAMGLNTEQPVHQAVPVDVASATSRVASATSRALEFAEYMAKGAERLLEALRVEDILGVDMEDDPGGTSLSARFDAARESRGEFATGLRSDIYEFRKRAEKVANKDTA